MKARSQSLLVDSVATIYRRARRNRTGDCCMVAPHPDLRESLKGELDRIRGAAKGSLGLLLQAKDRSPAGMNDGLIYPGDQFPLGTPLRIARAAAADRAPLRGTVRVIVVLAQFSDKAMTQTKQHFEELFFSTGILPHGSVREYYREVTNNLVDVVGEVVGPYQLPKKLSEYCHGASGTGSTEPNARTMARDAAVAANPDVVFDSYDNDGDGYVDAFIVVHAGPGAEATGSTSDIWSHKWILAGGAYNADQTKIYAYLTVPEDSLIGVCCHELGHLLFGFPDLYDTDYSSEGVGNWCLMGGGSWNGGGAIPAHPSAWCKDNQGWATAVVPTANATVNIEDVKTGHRIYKLWKNGTPGSEYFLVENRQRTLYDQALPGGGLLIWHVDEAVASNSDENHYKVALLQADGKKNLEHGDNRGDAGDPYPGSANNTTFDNASTPNSKSYGGAVTCVAVTGIGTPGPIMTARLTVKCVTVVGPGRKIVKDAKDRRDKHKEIFKEKDAKDLKDLRKDVKEFKEFKEFEKPVKEKDKDAERPGSWPGGELRAPGWWQGLSGAGDLESRVAALEAQIAALEPFIDASLRPDLRGSALNSEEDVAALEAQMEQAAAQAKRLTDSPR